MATKKPVQKKEQNLRVVRITRTVYFFIAFFALSIIMFDSGNLLTKNTVTKRWTILSVLLIINTFAWYLASQKSKQKNKFAIVLLTSVFIAFCGFMTYWERGMASTSTIFYALPLLLVATLKNRHALIATATLAAGTYAFATVKYFNDFFNEGYRIQLWGNVLLYGGSIFALTWLIMIIAGLRHDSD